MNPCSMGPKSKTPAALGTHSARAGATKSTRSKRAATAGPGAAEVGLGQLGALDVCLSAYACVCVCVWQGNCERALVWKLGCCAEKRSQPSSPLDTPTLSFTRPHTRPHSSFSHFHPHTVGTAPSGTTTAAVAERTLRLFDLDTRFGPTACISRRARWERADGLGLDPPREVLSLLAVPGVSQEGLWHKRL